MERGLRAKLTELQSEWLEHLRSWVRSGLCLMVHARREGLGHHVIVR
jgi:hypothetical protein